MLVLEDLVALAHEFTDEFSGLLTIRGGGNGLIGMFTGGLRVSIAHVAAQAFAAQNQHKAILLFGGDKQFNAWQFHLLHQHFAQFFTGLSGDAPRPAIGDHALGVHRTKIAPGSYIVGAKVKINTQRAQHTPADFVFHRVVAKEGQMGLAAARCDPKRCGVVQTQNASGGQGIHIRGFGRLQLRFALRRERQTAQTIHH